MLDVTGLDRYPSWVNAASQEMLEKSYIDDIEGGLRDQFKRMCKTAARHAPKDGTDWEQKFFDMMWKGWYSNSTPCLSNLGNPIKGMPVSCSSTYMADDLGSIYSTKLEIAMLTKKGFGTAVHLDSVRPRGSLIQDRFPAAGVMPIIDGLAGDMKYVSQGNRRGSIASHLSVEHGDFKEVCKALKERPKGLNIGWNISEKFIEKLGSGDRKSKERYEMLMENRYVNGKGYLTFIDKCNRYLPDPYKAQGLTFKGSNLCQEVLLPTDDDHTLSCILGSLNVARYDEWKDTDLVKTAITYLDCVASEFLFLARGVVGFDKIINFTEKFRALGLGQMGLHTYLQDKSIVWGSYECMMVNNQIAKQINEQSKAATHYLANVLGEPSGCVSHGVRNASRLAIAPTKSSSNIMGGVSQGIEPYFSAAFVEVLSTGNVLRENPAFVRLLNEKGLYSKELMSDLAVNYNGSVQHLDFLTQHERDVFRGVFEINQMDVIKMAASRQRNLDQMQSINLTFGAHATPEEISAVHKEAFLNPDVLSLYYMRRVTEDKMGTHSQVVIEDCLACE